NIIYASTFGGSGPTISPDAKAGAGSISFDGGSYLTPTNQLLSTLAGSFTISLWVNTTQDNGDPNDYAFYGDGIISADVPGQANDLVPVALTGGQVAFNTGNSTYGYDDTINSSATVNDGNWHHVVVSRNQVTGEKDIYIDGVLDNSDFDTTNLLNDPQLLTIGAISDASNSDPSSPDYNGYNGYDGLLDDIQMYDRVLTPDEVAFLYNNPGATLGSFTNPPSPVSVTFDLSISRQQGYLGNLAYDVQPYIASISPVPITTHRVESPDGSAFSEVLSGNTYDINGGRISTYASLDDAIYACTNNPWTLYINKDDPSQQVFHFNVSISGLTTNLLATVNILVPANNAVNIATNTLFQWSGPANYSFVTVEAFQLPGPVLIASASLPGNATNWPSPPGMPYGTNDFSVIYNLSSSTNFTFTTPVDDGLNPVSSWNTLAYLYTLNDVSFVVGAPAPLPVLLTNLTRVGGNLQFSFQTLAGRPHTIQSRTNLTAGAWVSLTNFTGDGSLKQFTFPATNPPVRFFRVLTQ
ncbi:MAG: LamG domain-containing protein, partial [Limisphaerales bacterium]